MWSLIMAILAGVAGFAGGVLYSQRSQMPAMRELGRYRTNFWRSDINEPSFNVPGTKFRFSLDGRKVIYVAEVQSDGRVIPVIEPIAEPFPYLEGPAEPLSKT